MLDLNTILDVDNNRYIINTLSDIFAQSFCFDLLLQQYAKEGRHLFLILLSQNWQHYNAVATKNGINLKHLKDKQQLRLLDFFDYDGMKNGTNYAYDWNTFTNDIFNVIDRLPERSIIMIDDLSVLAALNFSTSQIYGLIRRIRRNIISKDCTLFIGSFYRDDDEKLNTLITTLLHECHVWVDCHQPITGYSMQIHGITKCFNRLQNKCSSFNYRLSNRNVIFKNI